jgi:1,5-anhydro-D-fructose reductase (1,5-anhydro-D-mannitol-forming)
MTNHKISIVGLGVMGQRMLNNMARYAGFTPASAFDPNPDARARVASLYPNLRVSDDVASVIEDPTTSAVYIASPPQFHAEHALRAFAAGKHVYCEKPLGVDVADSQALAAAANASGQVHIVNFSLASAAATRAIEQRLQDAALGAVVGVDVRLHFATWPRAWQMDAASWLSYRHEGGFAREVLSHWIYLTQRLLGTLELKDAWVRYPEGDLAETHLHAALRVGAIPVSVAASTGGDGPDLVEYSIWGEQSSCRIVDWNQLYTSAGGDGWQAELSDIDDPRERGYESQLSNAHAAFARQSHSMPTFDEALAVQTLIEAMLAQSPSK